MLSYYKLCELVDTGVFSVTHISHNSQWKSYGRQCVPELSPWLWASTASMSMICGASLSTGVQPINKPKIFGALLIFTYLRLTLFISLTFSVRAGIWELDACTRSCIQCIYSQAGPAKQHWENVTGFILTKYFIFFKQWR